MSSTSADARGFRAEVQPEYIALFDGDEELVYWDATEWQENPDLVVAIVNAVKLGYTEGADGIRVRLITN